VGTLKPQRQNTIVIWLILGACVGVLGTVVLLSVGFFTRNRNQDLAALTPMLKIIPAPSTTPTLLASPTSAMEGLETPSATPAPVVAGEIAQGQLVEISGTGGDGLRLRVQPGLSAAIAFLGVESEVFEVEGGPQEADGYQWWFLRNPYNTEKTGWAVSTYLRPISAP
jgi:hypothetical protein